ncbi:hypothetical protein KO361_04920 [Candidatus Woesearchaeota archaeon]|nr:hypothetical protein [Candidatus Woesearchaeota archaeon]
MKKKKGQAAIEFLTTYSWAIMGILITIGALTYFDIFNTNRFVTERCDTGAQISCVEAALTEEGVFLMRLTNNHPVSITITSLNLRSEGINQAFTLTEEIDRGATKIVSVPISGFAPTRNRELIDLDLSYRRTTGTREYNVSGSVVVRPISAEIFTPTP